MSGENARHPDDGELLTALDGELSDRKARRVRIHLDECAQCRAALAQLEEAAHSAAECWSALKSKMPAPPAAWRDLAPEFARIDVKARDRTMRGALAERMRRFLAPPSLRWSAATVATLALAAALLYQWRETPSVQAAALLRKAVSAADARPMRARRVHIRTASLDITRTVGQARADSGAQAIEALFRAANYSWEDPFCARSFQEWRVGLPNKRDEISQIGNAQSGDGAYQIRTTTSDNEIVSAAITVRRADLEPTWERLEFRNREWVEMSEATESNEFTASPAGATAEATGGAPSHRMEAPPRPEARALAPGMAIAEELQVFAALHQVGADLGDPIEIERSAGRVLVSGAGIPPARQQQLHAALDSLPKVSVRFTEPGTALPAPPASNAPAPVSSRPAPSLLQQRMGGSVSFESFKATLLDRSDAAMARAFALRRLAQEFPPEVEREASASDRDLLRELARQHVAALAAESGSIEASVNPALGSRAAASPAPAATERGPWQPAAEDVLRAARDAEATLAALLGAAPAEPTADLPSRFTAAMANLKASLEHCRLLLSYDGVGQRE